jgi:hypothetical protein
MLKLLIFAFLSSTAAGPPNLAPGWGLVFKADTNSDASEGPTIQNEIGNAVDAEGKLVWGQVLVTPLDGLTLDIAARGCGVGITDFRQNVTMPRRSDLAAELEALTGQAEQMFSVLEGRCRLGPDARAEFMRGFEAAYRQIFAAYRD